MKTPAPKKTKCKDCGTPLMRVTNLARALCGGCKKIKKARLAHEYWQKHPRKNAMGPLPVRPTRDQVDRMLDDMDFSRTRYRIRDGWSSD